MANGPGTLTALASLLDKAYDPTFEKFQNEEASYIRLFSRDKPKNDVFRWHIESTDVNPIWSYSKTAMLDDPRAHLATDGIGTSTLFLAPNVHSLLEASMGMRFVAQTLELDGQSLESVKGQPGAFVQLVSREKKRNLADFWKQINDLALSWATTAGNGGLNIDGIGVILDDQGTTYAGVNYSTFPEFKPYWNRNGGTPRALTLALMYDVIDTLETWQAGGVYRDAKVASIHTGTKQFRAYGNLLTGFRRYTGSERMDGGFKALDFEGRPVTKVPGYATDRMHFYSPKTRAGSPSIVYGVQRNMKTEDKSQQVTDGILFITTHYSNLFGKGRGQQGVLADLQ